MMKQYISTKRDFIVQISCTASFFLEINKRLIWWVFSCSLLQGNMYNDKVRRLDLQLSLSIAGSMT